MPHRPQIRPVPLIQRFSRNVLPHRRLFMIRRFATLFLVLFMLSVLPLYRVSASAVVVIGSCSSITLSGTVTPAVPIGVFVEVLSGTTPLGLVSTPAGAGGAYSVTVNF